MSFRPTAGQALAWGTYLGALAGLAICCMMGGLWATGVAGFSAWLAATPLALGLLTGAGWGLVFGRGEGADIDDRGIHPVPGPARHDVSWQRVVDLRPERRGQRTYVVAHLDSGEVTVLRAPYDGRLLARDRQFERKVFMLRHLWETHRRTINGPATG